MCDDQGHPPLRLLTPEQPAALWVLANFAHYKPMTSSDRMLHTIADQPQLVDELRVLQSRDEAISCFEQCGLTAVEFTWAVSAGVIATWPSSMDGQMFQERCSSLAFGLETDLVSFADGTQTYAGRQGSTVTVGDDLAEVLYLGIGGLPLPVVLTKHCGTDTLLRARVVRELVASMETLVNGGVVSVLRTTA